MDTRNSMTFRRWSDYYFGWTLVAAMLVVGVGATRFGEAGLTAGNIVYLGVMLPLGWLAWLATVHPKVVVTNVGLSIVNWFVKYEVPWSAVEGVSGTAGLTVELRNGQRISPASGSASLSGSGKTASLRKHVRAALEEYRETSPTQEVEHGRVVSRLDIKPLHFLATALLVVFLVWLLGLI